MNKSNKWDDTEAKLKELLTRLREEEAKKEGKLPKQGEPNSDVLITNKTKDSLQLIAAAIERLREGVYNTAESLLKYIYRVTPLQEARIPISSARRLVSDHLNTEAKWVKRRAKLLKEKTPPAVIRRERAKYAFDRLPEVLDLLGTATLVLNENNSFRSGTHYVNIGATIDVVLPPKLGDGIPTATVPVIFATKNRLHMRDFTKDFTAANGYAPEIKDLQSNTYLIYNVKVAGFSDNKIKHDKAQRQYREHIDANAQLMNTRLVHTSSDLFWYPVNFPVSVLAMYFGDTQLTDSYGNLNSPLNMNIEMSPDEFVRMRNRERMAAMQRKMIAQKEQRLNFEASVKAYMVELENIENALLESREVLATKKLAFTKLTAIDLDEHGDPVGGISVSQYKKLRNHMLNAYKITAGRGLAERQHLRALMHADEMKARVLYYEIAEIAQFMANLRRKHAEIGEIVDNLRNIERGTGKMAKKGVALDEAT